MTTPLDIVTDVTKAAFELDSYPIPSTCSQPNRSSNDEGADSPVLFDSVSQVHRLAANTSALVVAVSGQDESPTRAHVSVRLAESSPHDFAASVPKGEVQHERPW